MRTRWVVLVSLLSVAIARAAQPRPDAVPADTIITLQRGGCEKRCAVYKIMLFADGTLIYDGQYYVRKDGVVSTKVDVTAIKTLVDEFRTAGYFTMQSQYGYDNTTGCQSVRSDAPVAISSISTGGVAKSVIHHRRCVEPALDRLTQLEDKIDKVANSGRWIK